MSKIVLASVAALAVTASADSIREKHEAMFIDHCHKFGLNFPDGKEFVHRLEIFALKVIEMELHNADPTKTWKMGTNQFSHLTEDEWRDAVRLVTRPPYLRSRANKVHGEPLTAAPASVDWVSAGAVTPVKNQGQCGSCWTFSTTGSMEGAYFLAGHPLTSFSEQELVSCDSTDQGCNGGWMDSAFTWIQGNGGITTEASYPYTSGSGNTGSCKGTGNSVPGTIPTGFVDVQAGSVSALMSAVAQQPVSIAIQANQASFQSYSGGVLTGKCGQQLDHGVLAVGYGTLNGVDYWKVKNSWGTTWGEDGYILIERSSANKCGVLSAASYPTL